MTIKDGKDDLNCMLVRRSFLLPMIMTRFDG